MNVNDIFAKHSEREVMPISCEKCNEEAYTLCYRDGWYFSCSQCTDGYFIVLRDLVRQTQGFHWLDHLNDKNWFPEKRNEFVDRYSDYCKYIRDKNFTEIAKHCAGS